MNKLKYFITLAALFIFCSTATAQSIEWVPMEKAQKLALEHDKKVMIFAEALWCGYCKRMKEDVFPQEAVADSIYKYFYPVKVDIESSEKLVFNGQKYTEQGLARKFRIYSTPTFIFLAADGSVIGLQPGFMRADIFNKILSYVGSDMYTREKFKEFF